TTHSLCSIGSQSAPPVAGCVEIEQAADRAGAFRPRLAIRLCIRCALDEKMTDGERSDGSVVRWVLPGQVVSQDLAAVFVVVAVRAQVLPVAAVGGIVGVIPVLVMDGEQMQRLGFELARALRTDPAVNGERPLAIAGGALARGRARFVQYRRA